MRRRAAAGAVDNYDFGSAAGCPPYGGCDNGWRRADEYQMAWGDADFADSCPKVHPVAGRGLAVAPGPRGSGAPRKSPVRR